MSASNAAGRGVCADPQCGRTVNLYVPSTMSLAFPRAHLRPDKSRCAGANMLPLPETEKP